MSAIRRMGLKVGVGAAVGAVMWVGAGWVQPAAAINFPPATCVPLTAWGSGPCVWLSAQPATAGALVDVYEPELLPVTPAAGAIVQCENGVHLEAVYRLDVDGRYGYFLEQDLGPATLCPS